MFLRLRPRPCAPRAHHNTSSSLREIRPRSLHAKSIQCGLTTEAAPSTQTSACKYGIGSRCLFSCRPTTLHVLCPCRESGAGENGTSQTKRGGHHLAMGRGGRCGEDPRLDGTPCEHLSTKLHCQKETFATRPLDTHMVPIPSTEKESCAHNSCCDAFVGAVHNVQRHALEGSPE